MIYISEKITPIALRMGFRGTKVEDWRGTRGLSPLELCLAHGQQSVKIR